MRFTVKHCVIVKCLKPMIDLHYCCLNDARSDLNWERCGFFEKDSAQTIDRCCFEVDSVSRQLQFSKGARPEVLRMVVCQGNSFLEEHNTKC